MQTMDFPFFTTNIFGYWRKTYRLSEMDSIHRNEFISKFIPTVI